MLEKSMQRSGVEHTLQTAHKVYLCNMMHETYRVDPDPDLGRLERVPPPDVDALLAAVAGHGEADVAVLVAGMLHQVLERRLDLGTGHRRNTWVSIFKA